MWAKGQGFPPDICTQWRWLSRGSQGAKTANTAIGASAKVDAATAGIKIRLLPGQALHIRQYRASMVEHGAEDNVLFLLGGEFALEVSPFGLGTGIQSFPAWEVPSALASALASGAAQGLNLSDIGTDFVLMDHWFAWDESPADNANFLASAPPGTVQLHTVAYVYNTSAVGKSVDFTEGAQWDIYERRW